MFASRNLFIAYAVIDGHTKTAEDAIAHVTFQAVDIALEIVQVLFQTAGHSHVVYPQHQCTPLRVEHTAHHFHQVVSLHLNVRSHIIVRWEDSTCLKLKLLPFNAKGIALGKFHLNVKQLFDLSANVLLLSFEWETRGEIEGENQTCQLREFGRNRLFIERFPQEIVFRLISHTSHEQNFSGLFAK